MKRFSWIFGRSQVASTSPETSAGIDDAELDAREPHDPEAETTVTGERTTASVSRPASLQSRASNVLAAGLLGAMTLGLIGWYYAHSLSRGSKDRDAARSSAANKAQGEMVLPPLGRVDPPSVASSAATAILGPPPDAPGLVDVPDGDWPPRTPEPDAGSAYAPTMYAHAGPPTPSPEEAALTRKLSAVVFARQTSAAVGERGVAAPTSTETDALGGDASGSVPGTAMGLAGTRGRSAGDLDALFTPSATPAVLANVLPTQTLLLPKGAFLDCTLETAIDSTLPGMTTCVTATDTFGADGRVVLLERGTKLVGETRGQVRQGSARIFVLWTEARTPTGVVVPLASPGTDELGRSGLAGEVDRHFIQRFGAAILISVIDGAIQAMVQAQQDGGDSTVIYSPSTSRDIMTEVLRSTVDIPPTVVKPQGDRIQVLVARDLDFRSVYELRPVARR